MNAPLANTARAKMVQPMSSYTLAECAAIIGDTGVNYGALGHRSPEELTEALYAIIGSPPRKRIEEVRFADLETTAAYFARKARERRS